jgi:hypothetical protein
MAALALWVSGEPWPKQTIFRSRAASLFMARMFCAISMLNAFEGRPRPNLLLSTSPTMINRSLCSRRQMLPGVCPGVCSTLAPPSIGSSSPSVTGISTAAGWADQSLCRGAGNRLNHRGLAGPGCGKLLSMYGASAGWANTVAREARFSSKRLPTWSA